ncbi:MAG: hypothetical protein B7X40_06705 [Cellulomonas sp. 14-74-6]|nr:MAG: hypothetical protein B7X40_06705 [Cellulomonas sp. 14-74-6]
MSTGARPGGRHQIEARQLVTPAPRPQRTARRSRLALTSAVLATLLVLVDQSGAVADPSPSPTPPSAVDVQGAQAAVQAAKGSVAQMEVRLAELSVVGDQADVAVQVAGEKYTQALSDAQSAQTAADQAAQRSTQAAADAETARRGLVALARQMARSGGGADLLEAVLSADGFQDVAQRTSTLTHLTGKADETVQRFRAATLVADTLRDHAAAAASEASAAKDTAQQALDAAQQASDDAQAQIAAASTERDQLINALAVAQQTSATVERARQDALDAARQQRENAAAQAARLVPTAGSTSTPSTRTPPAGGTTAPPATTTPPAGTGTGGASGGTSGGTTAPPVTAPPVTAPPVTAPVTTPTTPPPAPPTSDRYGLGTGVSRGSAGQGQAAVSWAEAQVGLPYIWGGVGPDGFDCSGLTMKAWSAAGVGINRTAADQYKQVLKISYSSMRPGDLVFWATDPTDPSTIYHVSLFVGGGQIVEAANPSVPVRIAPLRWANAMPFAGRP